MTDEETLNHINLKIKNLNERIVLIEKELRLIREDILSGNPKERMQKRMLENRPESLLEKKKKIEEDIRIRI
jgi:hypothetical protein